MSASAASVHLHTSWGVIEITLEGGQVVGCTIPDVDDSPRRPPVVRRVTFQYVPSATRRVAEAAGRFVQAMLEGRAAACPPLRLPEGTDFQRAVWKRLLTIPRGQVMTYGGMAEAVGRPRASRAAGQACGANPLPLFIPCHRVVGRSGAWGGFSSGLAWKRHLLAMEKTCPDDCREVA